MKVFILATCRKPELARMTELVFDTLRIGFPTAEVTVFLNGPDCETNCPSIRALAEKCGCKVENHAETIHHKWIEELITANREPFYLLDTDVVFYDNFERFTFDTALAGYRIPEWQSDITQGITRARLHGSLLYMDPVKVITAAATFMASQGLLPFMPSANLIHPIVTAFNQRLYFYDTCAMLYHLIGGTAFNAEQKGAYFHFQFGTIPDVILPTLADPEAVEARRKWVLEDVQRGRGLWREYDEYFAARVPTIDGTDVIAPITKADADEAIKWNIELCQGNREAMAFCDLWYNYCHGIDDLVDTMQDGRPVMSKEQIISLFFKAAVLYNQRFFLQNRELLFPIVVQTTNTFADSVAWEHSPEKHLRTMGDVFRTCGNEMYFMVALICGGEQHMRKMSMAIKERDWLGQHDEHGNPT